MKQNVVLGWVWLILTCGPGQALAQLVAVDDRFAVPYLQQLVVEAPGVLDNDSYNDEPAVDGGVTALLIAGPQFGTLECETNAGLELCADGSFTYTTNVGFPGSDSFVYRAMVGIETLQATVMLTACDGGPTVFICWKETEFLAQMSELGYDTFQEGFENDLAWSLARSPESMPSITSQGLTWQSNHPLPPANNNITTGGGPARSGLWGVFDPSHGYATGTAFECDVDFPAEHCLYKDGFTGTRVADEGRLYAVGGYFTGSASPKLAVILDGGVPLNLGIARNGFQFFGVIVTSGFDSFRIEETDGKVGQARYVFADDFTFGIVSSEIFVDGFESGDTSAWSSR